MDGFEALKFLKSDNRYMDIPVFFLRNKEDALTGFFRKNGLFIDVGLRQ